MRVGAERRARLRPVTIAALAGAVPPRAGGASRAAALAVVSLYSLVGRFAWRHRNAYAGAAAMLTAIAVLTVWVPRRIGHLIDGLVADRLTGMALAQELAILIAMGVAIYLLRVGWRIALFSAAFRLGIELRTSLYERLTLQGAVVLPSPAHRRPDGARHQRRRRGRDGRGRGLPRRRSTARSRSCWSSR